MTTDCLACQFLNATDKPHQILDTEHWTVGIGNDHAYLGRGFVTLRQHKGSLSELSDKEWDDFQNVVRKLEAAYKTALRAEPLNWGCYMNNAYRTEPANPHVHWHIFPRYKEPQTINGVVFDDPLFGEFYDDNASRIVDETTIGQIADKLRQALDAPTQ